jgi:hypothetical protein
MPGFKNINNDSNKNLIFHNTNFRQTYDETVLGSEDLLQLVKKTQPIKMAEQLKSYTRKHIHNKDRFHVSTSRAFSKA